MARRLTNVENFKQVAENIGISVSILIQIANLWNSMSDEEKSQIIELEEAF